MYHKEAVEKYPLQAYASALLFSPADSMTRRLFQHEEPEEVTVKPAISNGWSACLQTLEGHSSTVSSVAFSHDSTRLASASYDSTVKIWDASSRACLSTINIGTSLRYLSFDSTSTFIYTERGTITISTSQITDDVDVTASKLQCQDAGLDPDGIWVTRSGRNILWIPSDYRPSCSAVSGTHVGMGVGSGRVWLCEVT